MRYKNGSKLDRFEFQYFVEKKLKTVIFDLGAVLLNLNFQLTIDAFVRLGISNFEEVFSKHKIHPTMEDFECGRISNEQFVNFTKQYLPSSVQKNEIIDAWNALLLDFPEENIIILERIASKYDVFLLSNTNDIHVQSFNQTLMESGCFERFYNAFDKAYFSHEIGFRKPYSDAYKYVINENRLNSKCCLFIDDTEQNVIAAEELGITGIHLTNQLASNLSVISILSQLEN